MYALISTQRFHPSKHCPVMSTGFFSAKGQWMLRFGHHDLGCPRVSGNVLHLPWHRNDFISSTKGSSGGEMGEVDIAVLRQAEMWKTIGTMISLLTWDRLNIIKHSEKQVPDHTIAYDGCGTFWLEKKFMKGETFYMKHPNWANIVTSAWSHVIFWISLNLICCHSNLIQSSPTSRWFLRNTSEKVPWGQVTSNWNFHSSCLDIKRPHPRAQLEEENSASTRNCKIQPLW